MLKQRILTAFILIPVFLVLLFKLPPLGFCILTAMVMLWGAYEWSFLMGVKQYPYCLLYPLVILLALLVSLTLPLLYVLDLTVLCWFLALFLVLSYSHKNHQWGKGLLWRGIMGVFVLVPCWLAVNFLRSAEQGVNLLLFLFVLIWGADIAAYFVGKKWGKNKLLPTVSPGKTWQGMVGALAMTILIVLFFLYISKTPHPIWPAAIALSLITVLFSILGDLFESMLKRQAGLKDSGHLLPGHGGILDRIDSLTAAAPVFVVGILFLTNFFH